MEIELCIGGESWQFQLYNDTFTMTNGCSSLELWSMINVVMWQNWENMFWEKQG